MTEKETVEYFKEMTGEDAAAYELCPCFSDHKEMAKIALAALEKQTPKKPINDGYVDLCPCCYKGVLVTGFYCWNCGQALDWSEDDG